MSPSPEPLGQAPSDRLWRWLQSFTRTAGRDSDGISRVESRQVYILPTSFGLLYSVMLLSMLFGANNYGSNPAFLFTFLLAGLGMAALFQTWKNLVGLELLSVSAEPVFYGQQARYRLRLRNPYTAPRPGISGYIWRHKNSQSDLLDLPSSQDGVIEIERRADRRGYLPAGRIALTTRYPLGLLKSWAYIQVDEPCLVYPAPAELGSGLAFSEDAKPASRAPKVDGDDFAGHKPYQDGDNVMHVDWKALARGQGWNMKNFEQNEGEEVWLRWESSEGETTELRLSRLVRSVLDLEQAGVQYGLALPKQRIEADSGLTHQHQCLKALALFEG